MNGGVNMKVITVISSENAKVLQKEKKLSDTDIMEIYTKEIKELIGKYIKKNTSYECTPIIGVSKVDGKDAIIEKCFEDLPRVLPLAIGDYILEMRIHDDEVTTIGLDDFNELEMSVTDIDKDSVEYAEIVETLNTKLKIGKNEKGIRDELCFLPEIRLSDCKAFIVLTEEWGKEDKDFNKFKSTKLNSLKAFKVI